MDQIFLREVIAVQLRHYLTDNNEMKAVKRLFKRKKNKQESGGSSAFSTASSTQKPAPASTSRSVSNSHERNHVASPIKPVTTEGVPKRRPEETSVVAPKTPAVLPKTPAVLPKNPETDSLIAKQVSKIKEESAAMSVPSSHNNGKQTMELPPSSDVLKPLPERPPRLPEKAYDGKDSTVSPREKIKIKGVSESFKGLSTTQRFHVADLTLSDHQTTNLGDAYDAIPVIEQVKLPRGGISMETKAVGRVQVGFIRTKCRLHEMCWAHRLSSLVFPRRRLKIVCAWDSLFLRCTSFRLKGFVERWDLHLE